MFEEEEVRSDGMMTVNRECGGTPLELVERPTGPHDVVNDNNTTHIPVTHKQVKASHKTVTDPRR
ncbi:hypothetical protein PGTUg99_000678 [Puccinia graminis f. sp. tritici]|uniref:Uncharacterized protein n=1 Tax=Puccinia graminis f. sp. tritici TaxID=56615 RepID=A0A5B0SGC1_PUCGR|nr:hypothetical protein PGTUg99_002335 [Puccinia graminis f. sp. tritici]KAA1136800.1 hypothetical protein PGTUg99_000678 [Puccinia graminis f. sp. tritici]